MVSILSAEPCTDANTNTVPRFHSRSRSIGQIVLRQSTRLSELDQALAKV